MRTNLLLSFATLVLVTACGTNLYSTQGKSNTRAAREEEALIALDKKDYSTSTPILRALWEEEKTDNVAQLYAVSLLGEAKIELFTIIQDSVKTCFQSKGNKAEGCNRNELVASVTKALPTDLRNEQVGESLKGAVDILGQAPSREKVATLMCFVGGIYAEVVVSTLSSSVSSLRAAVIRDLPSAGMACTSSASRDLQATIKTSLQKMDAVATNLADVSAAVGECLSVLSGSTSSDGIQKTLDTFTKNADKGCSTTITVGSIPLPTCYSSVVTDYSHGSAGDGKVDACEVFSNCVSGACFK